MGIEKPVPVLISGSYMQMKRSWCTCGLLPLTENIVILTKNLLQIFHFYVGDSKFFMILWESPPPPLCGRVNRYECKGVLHIPMVHVCKIPNFYFRTSLPLSTLLEHVMHVWYTNYFYHRCIYMIGNSESLHIQSQIYSCHLKKLYWSYLWFKNWTVFGDLTSPWWLLICLCQIMLIWMLLYRHYLKCSCRDMAMVAKTALKTINQSII